MIIMADQIFMFATTAGFMIGLAIILGIARTRRPRAAATAGIADSSSSYSSSSSSSTYGEGNGQKKVKRYNSDGKPVYE